MIDVGIVYFPPNLQKVLKFYTGLFYYLKLGYNINIEDFKLINKNKIYGGTILHKRQ